jgi:hypothetical protein
VAAALAERPDLRANVARLVAVMGRRPGHLFHPAEGAGGGILFGHGPVLRDFNFDQDRQAATTVIAMGLPTTLVPYEVARQVMLGDADLGRMDAAGNPAAWVARRARGWLDFWKEDIGREGFYPFDLLAGAYVVEPRLFDCAQAHAWVSQDSRLQNWCYDPNALLVGFERATRHRGRRCGLLPAGRPGSAPVAGGATRRFRPTGCRRRGLGRFPRDRFHRRAARTSGSECRPRCADLDVRTRHTSSAEPSGWARARALTLRLRQC